MIDAIILARKGSKRIKDKNIKKINGKRLIDFTFDAAFKSKLISRIICFTDDLRIKKFTKNSNIIFPVKRPKNLSNDTTTSDDTLYFLIKELVKKKLVSSDFILLQPTSPLRNSKIIDHAINVYKKKKINYLASFKLNKKRIYKLNKNYAKSYNLKLYQPDGVIYICNTKDFLKNKKIVSRKTYPIFLNKKFTLDVDTIEDFDKAKAILKNIK